MESIGCTTSEIMQTWLHMAKPGQAGQVTLFCFPYSGASASFYRSWVNTIPGVTVCPVELPGHGKRMDEPLLDTLDKLVETTTRALLPVLKPPYAFFGHSMGALLSFELIRCLNRLGHPGPLHLFVSGHGAPQLEEQHQHQPIHQLSDEAFDQKIREMGGTDEAFFTCPELREVFMPILRADFAICETYHYLPGDPLGCPITALGGLKDPHVPRQDLEAWQAHTQQAFKVRMFPGDHFYLKANQYPLIEILARELSSAASQAGRTIL